jgi:hypothetical protein
MKDRPHGAHPGSPRRLRGSDELDRTKACALLQFGAARHTSGAVKAGRNGLHLARSRIRLGETVRERSASQRGCHGPTRTPAVSNLRDTVPKFLTLGRRRR